MIIKIFILWRIGLFLLTYLGSQILPKVANSGLGAVSEGRNIDFWASWAQWDGGHYYDIAQNGYITDEDFAFFPLFPYLVKFLANILFDNTLLAGLLVANFAFIVFLIIFYNFIKKKFSPKIAQSAVISFLVFPTTFFAGAFYSEALFLAFCALTFSFLYKKKIGHAALFTILASITRLTGIVLTISIAYSYLSQFKFRLKKIDHGILLVLLSASGLILYSLFLYTAYGDPFKYLSAQGFWQRQITDPISTHLSYIIPMLTGNRRPLNDYFDLAVTLLFLTILILGRKKIPSSLWIFSVLVILIPASSGTLTSMPRYVLASLGAYIILGQYFQNRRNLRIFIWSISLFAQAILAALFVNGYWVA